ncbi:hypothetical protein NEOC95_000208, partial [Neochlamydia sp. AcF95]|nr:hypothetical protein [Neochlamydia sp. AcF95]
KRKFTFFLFKIDAMMEFFRVNQVGLANAF